MKNFFSDLVGAAYSLKIESPTACDWLVIERLFEAFKIPIFEEIKKLECLSFPYNFSYARKDGISGWESYEKFLLKIEKEWKVLIACKPLSTFS